MKLRTYFHEISFMMAKAEVNNPLMYASSMPFPHFVELVFNSIEFKEINLMRGRPLKYF